MRLEHRSWGSPADPPALLVHGAIDAWTSWSEVGPWLAQRGWHAIAVDLRGHGASPAGPDGADASLTLLADDLVETMRALRPDVNGVELLVGHSLGTLVGVTCAIEHPSFVKRLVLDDPPGGSIDLPGLADDVRDQIALARTDPAALLEQLRVEEPHATEDAARAKVAAVAAADPRFLAELLRALAGVDVARLVARCRVPTLALLGRDKGGPLRDGSADHGEYSTLSGEDRAAFRAALGAGGAIVELDAGHDVHKTACAAFLARLGAWLGEAPQAPAGP
jgi:pimeloyl-ACP methyl ester carboxylesterase